MWTNGVQRKAEHQKDITTGMRATIIHTYGRRGRRFVRCFCAVCVCVWGFSLLSQCFAYTIAMTIGDGRVRPPFRGYRGVGHGYAVSTHTASGVAIEEGEPAIYMHTNYILYPYVCFLCHARIETAYRLRMPSIRHILAIQLPFGCCCCYCCIVFVFQDDAWNVSPVRKFTCDSNLIFAKRFSILLLLCCRIGRCRFIWIICTWYKIQRQIIFYTYTKWNTQRRTTARLSLSFIRSRKISHVWNICWILLSMAFNRLRGRWQKFDSILLRVLIFQSSATRQLTKNVCVCVYNAQCTVVGFVQT